MKDIKFRNPNSPFLHRHVMRAAERGLPFIEPRRHYGEPFIITGSGPSLLESDHLDFMRDSIRRGAVLIACKESIRMLAERGFTPRYSVSMDPGPEQVRKTHLVDGTTYLLASSCHPALYDHVLRGGHPVEVFHSACGATEYRYIPGAVVGRSDKDEDLTLAGNIEIRNPDNDAVLTPVVRIVQRCEQTLYKTLFAADQQFIASGGLTVVNRALAVAEYFGAAHTTMVGCNYGYRSYQTYYADGMVEKAGNAGTELNDEALTDGRIWNCRPDQLVSAHALYDRIRSGRLTVLGDSLANSIANRERSFADRVLEIANQ